PVGAISTLSLHDALPIYAFRQIGEAQLARVFLDANYARILPQLPCELVDVHVHCENLQRSTLQQAVRKSARGRAEVHADLAGWIDRKSTRLNSSHDQTSY